MIFYVGNGGGSELMNNLKSSWASLSTDSNVLSKSFNQLYIKWTFYKNIQFPFYAHSYNNFNAFSS